ncbi:MAG: HlyD family efflux transporter periplasmic adaptor subunit [Bacteroidia bacterium]|nr:HlyD family efflux transporter periplasmic adaptor subunit [Bacteroidia bacterium]
MKSFRKLLQLLSAEKNNITHIYILAMLQGAFYLLVPLGIQAIISYTMAGQMSASLLLLSLLTVTVVLFIGLFQLWQMRINETVQQNLLVNVGIRFAAKIKVLHPQLHLTDYLPSKINQFFDVLTLQKGLSKILLDVSFAIISIFFGLIILSAYSTLFLVFTLLIISSFYIIIRYHGKNSMEKSMDESKSKYQFVDWLQSFYVQAKNQDAPLTIAKAISETDDTLSDYIEKKTGFFNTLDLQYRSILAFKILFTGVLLFTGIIMVQQGALNIGQFVAAEILVILVINSVEKLVLGLRTVYEVLTSTEKLFQVFELDEVEDSEKMKAEFKLLEKQIDGKIYNHNYTSKTKQLIYSLVLVSVVVLFLPWTQTVYGTGKLSTLNPEHRPQTVPSRISGRIEKWYVNEGQLVKKGDTIAYISEIKEDYFDPQLIERTQSRVKAKQSSLKSYESKINSINTQIGALNNSLILKTSSAQNKIKQAYNKLASDSIDYTNSANLYKIAEEQFKRFEELLAKGLVSKTEFENRKAKVQDQLAKKMTSENKWMNAKTELFNDYIDLNNIKQEYNEKIMKSESDKFSALSALYEEEANLTRIQNQLSNYSIRNAFYYVTAPQEGYITKSYIQGVGEIVKDGTPLVSIVPKNNTLSVEFYVEPMNIPLIHSGQDVQLTFDGWPAFVFRGWPGVSFGTYRAKIVAIDKVISENGKFRVLAINTNNEWPKALQVGAGVKALVMLNNVPVIYELWRQINGFPPEFYEYKQPETKTKKDEKK